MLSLQEMKTGDFAQYSRCFGLDGLEVMSARWVEHSFAPHMHDFYAVGKWAQFRDHCSETGPEKMF
jgi:hypothetical protein